MNWEEHVAILDRALSFVAPLSSLRPFQSHPARDAHGHLSSKSGQMGVNRSKSDSKKLFFLTGPQAASPPIFLMKKIPSVRIPVRVLLVPSPRRGDDVFQLRK